jgi:TonB family protein
MKVVPFLLVIAAVALIGCASERPVTKPRVTAASSCVPRYPSEAKRNGMQGEVVARVMVESSGTVSDVEIGRTSGFPVLDRAAMEAARCQRYEPGTVGGIPSAMWTEFPVKFVLRD